MWWLFLFFLNDFLLYQGWVFLLLFKVYWVTEFFQGVIDWRLSLGNGHLDNLVEYHLALILISGLAQIIYQFVEFLLLHAFNLLLNCIGYSLLIKMSNLNSETFGDHFLILPFDENVIKMIKIDSGKWQPTHLWFLLDFNPEVVETLLSQAHLFTCTKRLEFLLKQFQNFLFPSFFSFFIFFHSLLKI